MEKIYILQELGLTGEEFLTEFSNYYSTKITITAAIFFILFFIGCFIFFSVIDKYDDSSIIVAIVSGCFTFFCLVCMFFQGYSFIMLKIHPVSFIIKHL